MNLPTFSNSSVWCPPATEHCGLSIHLSSKRHTLSNKMQQEITQSCARSLKESILFAFMYARELFNAVSCPVCKVFRSCQRKKTSVMRPVFVRPSLIRRHISPVLPVDPLCLVHNYTRDPCFSVLGPQWLKQQIRKERQLFCQRARTRMF